MGQYKIVDNVLVAVMKKHVPEKKKTANLGRRGRARREEYVFEVPEQVGLFRDALDHSVWLWICKCCLFQSKSFRISIWSFRFVVQTGILCR